MMNPREILRWLVTGFLFGTGWAVAKLVWGVLAGFTAVFLPVLVLAALGWLIFSRLRPAEARRCWQQGVTRLRTAFPSGRGGGGGGARAQGFRHR